MQKKWWISGVCAAIGIWLIYAFGIKPEISHYSVTHTQPNIATEANAPTPGTLTMQMPAPLQFQSGLEMLPKSLQGIEMDGSFDLDESRHLIINTNLRRIFDFFFNGVGEEPEEQVIRRIRAYIAANLDADASTEANRVLDEYLAMKTAMDAMPSQIEVETDDDAAELRLRKNAIKAIRQQNLSAEVNEGFFAEEDQFDDYSLAKFEITQNHALSAIERSQKIAELEQALPPAMRENIEAVSRYQTLTTLTDDWQKSAGSISELRQIRENVVGAAAADRLEKLDQRRAEWNQRMANWLTERTQIINNAALPEPEKVAQLDYRRTQNFSTAELARVKAMEHIQDTAAPRN